MSENKVLSRVEPVLRDIGKVTGYFGSMAVTRLPHPYCGWIDWFDGRTYCTIFDLENASGVRLRNLFVDSSSEKDYYDFKPTAQFSVRGRLISKGRANDLEWYVLHT